MLLREISIWTGRRVGSVRGPSSRCDTLTLLRYIAHYAPELDTANIRSSTRIRVRGTWWAMARPRGSTGRVWSVVWAKWLTQQPEHSATLISFAPH